MEKKRVIREIIEKAQNEEKNSYKCKRLIPKIRMEVLNKGIITDKEARNFGGWRNLLSVCLNEEIREI